ncbi:PAS PAC sensor hybrid histidine kinase isoform A [Micractinium conductrix]|uniref:PAS PAC sensor hybrid histidine kinase isoform A n=1 Tax=Micractinium conductrix TaxID=554055 RepID=A0A2P6V1X0_9CHLO|nr:PAS PAC sensor hybrid histidine kinase isoform B [Micractinium conductrix]PSC68091.1 PAS PAC sensor hybrid histidine kinase isoform A [Micractinium conductrix]|eukprot:PSC68090.1 PAS PAC sensor hybrid histidine kinase isoform B [Micractinium conductrix]
MPSSRSSLIPSSPHASLAGVGLPQRQRRLRLVVAACAVLAAVVLLVAVEGWQQSAMQARHAEGAAVDHLGMPVDALMVEAGAGGKGARAGGTFWTLWQNRIADQEARVGAWRQRQKQIVYEETAAEEAAAAATNKAAVLAAAAAEADTLLAGAALGAAQQADDGSAVR